MSNFETAALGEMGLTVEYLQLVSEVQLGAATEEEKEHARTEVVVWQVTVA